MLGSDIISKFTQEPLNGFVKKILKTKDKMCIINEN